MCVSVVNFITAQFARYVVSRWYRAPEVLLSVQSYDEAIDVWGVGCTFGEMLGRKPLYTGSDYIQQLSLISALIGKPTESDLWFVTNPRYACIRFVFSFRLTSGHTR